MADKHKDNDAGQGGSRGNGQMGGRPEPHRRAGEAVLPNDLEQNPGIGQSKGAFSSGEDPEEIEADSTFEGDVENETNRQGGVNPRHLGRTNK